MRLIDADALLKALNDYGLSYRADINGMIMQAPTIAPSGDLISRADAIKAICSKCGGCDDEHQECWEITTLEALPSAEAIPTVIRAKTFMRKEDFDKWADGIKKQNKSIVCIPCDAEVVSAETADVYKAHEEEHLNIINRIKELQYAIAKTQTIVGKLVESAEMKGGDGE